MPSPTPPPFAAIDPAALTAVTGGASSRATTDERIMDKLVSITTAIKDAATQQAAPKNDAMSQLMPMMLMGMMKRKA